MDIPRNDSQITSKNFEYLHRRKGENMYFTSKRSALNFTESNSTIIPKVHHEITQVTWRWKKLSVKIIWQTSSLLEEDDTNDSKFVMT